MTTSFYLRPPVEELTFQLYARPLHPELFDVLAFRRVCRETFTLNLWLTTTGHLIAWESDRARLTEVAAGREPLPEWGHLMRHRFRGERSALLSPQPGLNYQVSLQVETLTPQQFAIVHRETLADASKAALMHTYASNPRWALMPVSAIHAQMLGDYLAISTFHTFPDELTIVKTQSLIEFGD